MDYEELNLNRREVMPEIIICEGCDEAFDGDEAAALSSDWIKIDDEYFCPGCKEDLDDKDE